MKRIHLPIILCLCSSLCHSQLPFKYDNTSYKAIFLNQVSRLMADNPGYLLLDVRSPGEYADSSQYTHMNMGKLKGARNIDIDSISFYIPELKKNSDKAIFVYCSHSQRSRRVSKLLSENGFKKIYNINGGMSVINEADDYVFPDKNKIYITDNDYKNISSTRACELILHGPNLLIIDLRNKQQFELKDSNVGFNIGRIKNAINIPEDEFKDRFAALNIPKEKKILVYDLYGYNSSDFAVLLAKSGYKNVYNLFEGIANLATDNSADAGMIKQSIEDVPAFKVIGVKQSIQLLRQHPEFVVLDARSEKEFANKADQGYLNLGHIKNAVHVDDPQLKELVEKKNKESYFLVYGSGQGQEDHSAAICKQLTDQGFKNVYLLYPGLYRFVWSTANIESCKDGRDLLTDHDGLY
jgi:rhodanese-related sulfurtransferase